MRPPLLHVPLLLTALFACRSTASSDPQPIASPPTTAGSCDPSPIIAAAEDALRSTGHAGAVIVLDLATGNEIAAVDTRPDDAPRVPPGSTMKPLIAMAALQAGVIEPEQSLECDGSWHTGDHELTCFDTHGPLDLRGSLATSCNVYSFEIASRLGADRIAAALDRVGLSSIASLVRTSADEHRYLASALGHGDAAVTPTELARAYAAMLAEHDPAVGAVRAGMIDAVTTAHGTARAAAVAGLDVAGKTGTAEHDDHMHAWFVGFAPASEPTVLVLAYVQGDADDTGGRVAAPIASRVLHAWMQGC